MSSFSLVLMTVFEASGADAFSEAISVLVFEVVGIIGVTVEAAVAPFGKVSAGPGGG